MNSILLALFCTDIAGAAAGMYATRSRTISDKFKAISAGIMVGVALFWIFPDLMQKSGAVHAALIVAVGLALLCGIDRFVYPVCPCCTHHHVGSGIGNRRASHAASGALIPLVLAICVHNLFDGWMAATAGRAAASTASGLGFGLIAHKIPEAFVFGLMLRSAATRMKVAALSIVLTSFAILAGGMMHRSVWTISYSTGLAASLALACSSFLFVGGHIFLTRQRSGGTRSAVTPLLVGLSVAAIVQQAASVIFIP
jgi:zinc transporter ZupT